MRSNDSKYKIILGFKLKHFRLQADLSLQELAKKTGLSFPYISQIEQGKKYPKPEKIALLGQALGKSYDELVSLSVEEKQSPWLQLLNSPFLNDFPWEQYGISFREIARLLSDPTSQAAALIQTLHDIGTNYDMRVEHFLLATLRAVQTMHLNYFEEIETAADQFRKEIAKKSQALQDLLEEILKDEGYAIDYTTLAQHQALQDLRSIWVQGETPKLLINEKLQTPQKKFLLLKEIGYLRLGLKTRAASTDVEPESFDQIYNSFQASYFAGAVLMDKKRLIQDLKQFYAQPQWNARRFAEIMKKYEATPEMFLFRLSEIVPKFFQLQQFHYMRFDQDVTSDRFILTKSLNTTTVFMPRGNDQNEHHCRRWGAIRSFANSGKGKIDETKQAQHIFVQRSRFIESDQEFFAITLVYHSPLTQRKSSITLGILINDSFKKQVQFWNDPTIPKADVHETCERCPLSAKQCTERVAPPVIYQAQTKQAQRKTELNGLIQTLSS